MEKRGELDRVGDGILAVDPPGDAELVELVEDPLEITASGPSTWMRGRLCDVIAARVAAEMPSRVTQRTGSPDFAAQPAAGIA